MGKTTKTTAMRVLMIDNYDSFTWNLVHYIGELGATLDVHRNDAIDVETVMESAPDAIVLSPGPCSPDEAGICLSLIARAKTDIPIFGVCLGHQAIGQAYGGTVVRTQPMHGKVSTVTHEGRTIFHGINGPFEATRYHSLTIDPASLPDELDVTARSEDAVIMALSHREHPVHGVQFHPESIASQHGKTILRNFLDLAAAWNGRHRAVAA